MDEYTYLGQAFAVCKRCGRVERSASMYFEMEKDSPFETNGTPRDVEAICEDCLVENLLLFNKTKLPPEDELEDELGE